MDAKTVQDLLLAFPALVHTGSTRMHASALYKAAEILADLAAERQGKTLQHVWGYSSDTTNKEHHSGRALDFMVHSDRAAGDQIAHYVIANAERFGLIHIIWYQRIWRGPYSTSSNPKGVWQDMSPRGVTPGMPNGDPTQNHLDHPHVWFAETDYVPEGGDAMTEEILSELRRIRRSVESMAGGPPEEPMPMPPPSAPPPPAPAPVPAPVPAPTPVEPPPSGPIAKIIGIDLIKLTDPRTTGPAVAAAQLRLQKHGHKVDTDGVYGPASFAAVKSFQSKNGLTADGVIGKKTWDELLKNPPPDVPAWLRKVGWRRGDKADVAAFQRMFNHRSVPALTADGVIGPKTEAAVQLCIDKGDRISANFRPSEFACKCGGKYATCRRIYQHRESVQDAEVYRTLSGPFTPLSAYRCPDHNRAVRGYVYSAHTEGLAFDVRAVYSLERVKKLNRFAAIGHNSDSAKTVRHIDRRNLSSRVNKPAISGKPNGYTFTY